jgi:hypothetical protein
VLTAKPVVIVPSLARRDTLCESWQEKIRKKKAELHDRTSKATNWDVEGLVIQRQLRLPEAEWKQ